MKKVYVVRHSFKPDMYWQESPPNSPCWSWLSAQAANAQFWYMIAVLCFLPFSFDSNFNKKACKIGDIPIFYLIGWFALILTFTYFVCTFKSDKGEKHGS